MEDYKTWKEGGNSLIDWEKWQPAIDKAKDAITWLRDHLLELKDGVGGWQNALELLATFIAGVWIEQGHREHFHDLQGYRSRRG